MVYLKQLKSILFHKWHVLRVGLIVGKIPLWRLLLHDWSKFSPTEFIYYARYKYGNGLSANKYKPKWAKSWLHHLHHNPHHPEHWLLSWRGDPKFYDDVGESIAPWVVVLPMPDAYVSEMIADMMATSKEFTGSYDITKWLSENISKMRLHSESEIQLKHLAREACKKLSD